MINSEYSPHKIAHHMERLQDVKKKGYCVPVTIHLAPTTRCNCRCDYCYVKEYNEEKVDIDRDQLLAFLEDAAKLGVKGVEFTGGGEPTFYPYFDEAVEKCNELNLDVGVVTNGFHLNPQVLRKAKWVRISIDTFDTEKYAKTRHAKMPDLSCVNGLARDHGVVMGASCVITAWNYKDIYDFTITARELGFRNVWLKGIEGSSELEPLLHEILPELERVQELSNDSFRVFVGEMVRDSHDTQKEFERCMFQHVALMVYADGSIYPCCSLQGRESFICGSIYSTSISELLKERVELPVYDCPLNCFWKNKNMFMDYLIMDDPRHVNFM